MTIKVIVTPSDPGQRWVMLNYCSFIDEEDEKE